MWGFTPESLRWDRVFPILTVAFLCTPLSPSAAAPVVPSLEAVRHGVASNEAKTALIRMEYEVRLETRPEARVPDADGTPLAADEPADRTRCLWAQDGPRVHSEVRSYHDDDFLHGDVVVTDGRVAKHARLPELMEGAIGTAESFRWSRVVPAMIGSRPFADKHPLSRLLVPQYARLCEDSRSIGDRPTVVVEIRHPDLSVYVSRIWIDTERYMPLRIEHYAPEPDWGVPIRFALIKSIKLHQLPNGGWIAATGTRSLPFKRGRRRWTAVEHVVVDLNSISVERKDIPDSLFDIDFPDDAHIINRLTES